MAERPSRALPANALLPRLRSISDWCRCQPLEKIRLRRPAHEACQQAVAPRDLFGRGAEQDHGVGGVEARLRAEGEFALAGPQFDFHRAQRHTERRDAAADRLQRRIDLIEAALGEILVALVEQAHLGRPRRPGGVLGRQPRIFQLEQMEFDFQAGEVIESGRFEPRKRIATNLPRRKRHRLAVPEKISHKNQPVLGAHGKI